MSSIPSSYIIHHTPYEPYTSTPYIPTPGTPNSQCSYTRPTCSVVAGGATQRAWRSLRVPGDAPYQYGAVIWMLQSNETLN